MYVADSKRRKRVYTELHQIITKARFERFTPNLSASVRVDLASWLLGQLKPTADEEDDQNPFPTISNKQKSDLLIYYLKVIHTVPLWTRPWITLTNWTNPTIRSDAKTCQQPPQRPHRQVSATKTPSVPIMVRTRKLSSATRRTLFRQLPPRTQQANTFLALVRATDSVIHQLKSRSYWSPTQIKNQIPNELETMFPIVHALFMKTIRTTLTTDGWLTSRWAGQMLHTLAFPPSTGALVHVEAQPWVWPHIPSTGAPDAQCSTPLMLCPSTNATGANSSNPSVLQSATTDTKHSHQRSTVRLPPIEQLQVQFQSTVDDEACIRLYVKQDHESNVWPVEDFVEPSPTLSPSQSAALEAIRTQQLTIIVGEAGTGKSYLLSQLALLGHDAIAFTTPYRRTVSHLTRSLESNLRRQNASTRIQVSTTCSWSIHHQHCYSNDCKRCGVRVLVIDEVGLASTATIANAVRWVRDNASRRLVLAGDPCQLPTISGGSVLSALLLLRPEWVVRLEGDQRMKQAQSDNAHILQLAHTILRRECHIPVGRGVIHEEYDVLARTLPVLLTQINLHTVVLACWNTRVKHLNRYLSNHHRQQLDAKFEPKTEIVHDSDIPGFKWIPPFAGAIVRFVAGDFKDQRGVVIRCYSNRSEKGEWYCDVERDPALSDQVWTQVRARRHQRHNRPASPTTCSVPQKQVRFAYAMTVNSAQGSEFDYVFLLLDNWNKLNARFLYTAVTRAKTQFTLISRRRDPVYRNTLLRGFPSLANTTLIPYEVTSHCLESDWRPPVFVSEELPAIVMEDTGVDEHTSAASGATLHQLLTTSPILARCDPSSESDELGH
jgi:hypothetical protein